jgi:apolipoprotein N-acyltransferase
MTQTYLTGDVTPLKKLSFYARFGDVLPVLSLTLTGIFFILALAKRADERKKTGRSRQVI